MCCRAGDVLCEIDSADFGRLVSMFITAQATVTMDTETLAAERVLLERNVELAQEVFDREQALAEQEITTLAARYEAERRWQDARLRRDSRLLELESRLARDRIELVAAERELELIKDAPIFDMEHRALVTSAVFAAVAFVEAAVNEVLKDAEDRHP